MNPPRVNSKANNSVTLTWPNVDLVSFYELSYGKIGESESAISGITENTYTFAKLLQGETYQFRVRAHNDCGTNDYSEVTEVGLEDTPDQMTVPTITMASPCSVTIRWTPPFDGGMPITAYNLNLVKKGTIYDVTEICGLD
jgi:hypothetical protein